MTFNEYEKTIKKWLCLSLPIEQIQKLNDNFDYGLDTLWNMYKGNKAFGISKKTAKEASLVVLNNIEKGFIKGELK